MTLMYQKLLISTFFLFLSVSTYALIFPDSLNTQKLQEKYHKTLTHKNYNKALINLNKLGDYLIYKELKHQESYALLNEFKPYLNQCSDSTERAKFYIVYAEAATYAQDYKKSVSILEEGISFLEKLQDSTLYAYGYAYLKAAENSNKLNRFSQSATYYQKAEKIFSQQKDTLMLLWTKNGLSTLFSSYALYDEAEEERNFIFRIANNNNYQEVLAIAHLRAAIDAYFLNNPKAELYHVRQSVKHKNPTADIQEIVSILSFAQATASYAYHQQKDSSNYYFKQLNAMLGNKTTKLPFINTYYTFAKSRNALVNGNLHDAEQHALHILNNLDHVNDWQNVIRANFLLAEIYEQQKNNKKALRYFKEYIRLTDSINKAASRKKFAYVQTQFETEKKDLEIAKQNQDIKLLNAKNRITNQWALLGGILIIGLSVVFYFWRARQFSIKKINMRKQFAQNLIQHIENERKRIARELHDGVGQSLLLIKNNLLRTNASTKELALIQKNIEEIREISHNLHPFQFEQLGLIGALQNMIAAFQENSSVFYSEELKPTQAQLSIEQQIFIYRILQECITNVEKHAKANACKLSMIETPTNLTFEIKDNGVGFDVNKKLKSPKHLGLKTLKERAEFLGAKLQITASPKKGTCIQISIPI